MKMGVEGGADMNGELSSELNGHCNAHIYSMIGPYTSKVSVLTLQLELAHRSIKKLEKQVFSLRQQLNEKDDQLNLTTERHAKARDEASQNALALKKHIAICEELKNEYEQFRRDRDAFEEQIIEAHEQRELAEKRATEAEICEKLAQRRLEKALQVSSMTNLERKRNGYLEEMLPNCISNERVVTLRNKPQAQRVMRKKVAAPLAPLASSGLVPEGQLEDEHFGQPTPKKKVKSEGLNLCNESPIDRRKPPSCHNDSSFHAGHVLVTAGKFKIEEKPPANDLSSMQKKLEASLKMTQERCQQNLIKAEIEILISCQQSATDTDPRKWLFPVNNIAAPSIQNPLIGSGIEPFLCSELSQLARLLSIQDSSFSGSWEFCQTRLDLNILII